MSWFSEYLKRTDDRRLSKWVHYFDIYERELTRFRTRPITFLEIGIWKGGSIKMWKSYFSNESTLVFIDIDQSCLCHTEPGVHVEIGNQADTDFLRLLAEKYGPFDVVLDDGSHICSHQIASFKGLWPNMRDQSLYIVEDCHSSYWPNFGGGYRSETSFIEFAKHKIDTMHSWYTEQDTLFPFDPFARELASVRFYDSITVFEKCKKTNPPAEILAQNGQVHITSESLKMRGRTSIFAGKDGT